MKPDEAQITDIRVGVASIVPLLGVTIVHDAGVVGAAGHAGEAAGLAFGGHVRTSANRLALRVSDVAREAAGGDFDFAGQELPRLEGLSIAAGIGVEGRAVARSQVLAS